MPKPFNETTFQYFSPEGKDKAYCEKLTRIVILNQKYINEQCSDCPFYAGSFQGMGIECRYLEPELKGETFVNILPEEAEDLADRRRAKEAKAEYDRLKVTGKI